MNRRTDLEKEFRHHIEESVDLLMASGLSREDAIKEAERRFGDIDGIAAETLEIQRRKSRRVRMREAAHSLGADVRYALRGLRRNLGFSIVVIATMALGTGAATSIFSVLDAVLLRPVPYENAERLVTVNTVRGDSYSGGLDTRHFSGWREAAESFADGWMGYIRSTVVRTDGPSPEPLSVLAITPGADTLVGLRLLIGRSFGVEDGSDVAVLSRDYYERLGADSEILGRTFQLETGTVTVIGVLEGGVKFPDYGSSPDVWVPIQDDFDFTAAGREIRGLQGVWARLRSGLDLAAAQDRADRVAESLQEADPLEGGWRVRLVPIGEHRANSDVERALWILSATVGLILLIALVNGVNLSLVRSTARSREFAVRTALGGSWLRLTRQLLIEGVTLGALGGVVAVALAWVALVGIQEVLPSGVTFFSLHALEIEKRTLLFAFGVSLVGGTLLGLFPALQAVRRSAVTPGGRDMLEPRSAKRLRRALVAGQVAVSMTLLVGAGLFVNSFVRLVRVDPGFDFERIAQADISLSPTRYASGTERASFLHRFEELLEAHPAIEGVTITNGTGFTFGKPLQAEGMPAPDEQPTLIPHTSVSVDYLRVMGIELIRGRSFEPPDASRDVAIVDRDLARFLWGDENAVGRRFRMGDGPWREVVGVARELRMMGRDQRLGPHQILYPAPWETASTLLSVSARTSGDPRAILPVIRETLRSLDPYQAIWRLRTAGQALAEEEDQPRFLVTLMSLLAGIAVSLASVGLYGVLAYSVKRRERELGVRMALGADRRTVLHMVLRDGLAVAAVGIALGVGGAIVGVRILESLLYDVDPRDPITLVASAVLFMAVAAVASLLPARRATRVDPVEALRAE